MTSGKTIKIEAGGDVQFSADEVGRDKIVGESTNKPEKKTEKIVSVASLVTKLVASITKAAAAIKALLGL